MRLALAFPECHPRGGVERVVWETLHGLAPRHDVTFLGARHDPFGVDAGFVPVDDRSPSGVLRPALFRRRSAAALAGVTADVTVTYGVDCPPGDVLCVQAVHRAWLRASPPVSLRGVTVPGRLRFLRARHQVLLELERRTFASERYRRVMAVGQGVADDLVELYGVDRAKLVVVPNGFSAEQCNPTRRAELRPRMRAELGLGTDDIALLLVANELHRKGFGQLLEATARLDDERVHIVLVGRLAPTPYQPTIDRLGLTDRVRWCGLADDVALYHAAADVFVMPTQYEAFGSVVVEALASGLPVITSALAGAAAAVVPDGNGLLQQDPLDVEELTELLRTALDPDRRRRWEETASPSVQDYEWSRVVAQVEDVLSSVSTAP